jgi:hypothetical protein
MRAIGRADLSLDLLAADYALARYGGQPLPDRENRRGVTRWRRLRNALPTPPPGWIAPSDGPGSRAPAPDAAPPIDAEVRRTL